MENVKGKIELIDIIIFAIVIIIFGACLLAFYPALMTSDSPDQIQQAMTNEYYDAHPVFHSYIMGNITKIFGSVSAVAILQILVFAFVWTIACKATRKENCNLLNKIFQILFTLIICLVPINFMYSISMWKDILYTYSILGIIICIYLGIKKNYNYSYLEMVAISVCNIFIMQTRHNGMPIGIILFIILIGLNFFKNKKIKRTLAFILISIITIVCSYIPQWTIHINESSSTASAFLNAKVYCMGALLNNENIRPTDEELQILNRILPVEEWKKSYDPYGGVPIQFHEQYDKKILGEYKEDFEQIFSKYAQQEPDTVLKHFLTTNAIAFSIKEYGCTNTFVTSKEAIREMSNGIYETESKSQFLNNIFSKIIEIFEKNEILYALFYRPATLLYLAVILVLYLIVKNKKLGYVLLLFPMLLNIGTYLFLIGSPDLRYYYPNFVTCYFLILVVAQMKLQVKKSENKHLKKVRKAPKTLIVVPAYNEGEVIKKVVEDIEKNNPNCDIIVINDGSKDNTLKQAKETNAIVLDLPNNLGIGGAVQTGFLYAYKNDYDIVIQIDGDGQHDASYVSQMIDYIVKEDYNMVIGSRFVEKTKYKQTFFRMLGINITSGIIKGITGKKIYDTTSGFRAIDRNIIEYFVKNYPYDYPEPDTNMQMILKGMKIKEIPVEMHQRTTGKSSISPLKSVIYMLKVSLSLVLAGIRKL